MAARPFTDLPDAGRIVYRFALLVLILTAPLLAFGAEVTSTNSGMAYATWPDADGRYLWPEDPATDGVLEHVHRLIGALVGICAIALVVATFLHDRRRLMRGLSVGLLGLVIIQGLLGGYRVLLDETFPILGPMVHGLFAQLVFSFMAFVAFAASMAWVPQVVEDGGAVRTGRVLAIVAWVSVFLQIALGAITRHANSDAAKWGHISFSMFAALAVLIAAAYSLGKFGKIPGFKRTNRTLLAILIGQMLFGFITLMVRRPKPEADTNRLTEASLVSLHVVLGAALLALLTVLVARSFRNLRPRLGP